jgi:ethanolamine permease
MTSFEKEPDEKVCHVRNDCQSAKHTQRNNLVVRNSACVDCEEKASAEVLEDVPLIQSFVKTVHKMCLQASDTKDTPRAPDVSRLVNPAVTFLFGKYTSQSSLQRRHGPLPGAQESKKGLPETQDTGTQLAMDKGWRHFLRRHLYHDIYPDPDLSPQAVFQIYLERRSPPINKARFLGIFGVALCNVISGEFAGWNLSISRVGYGHFILGNLLAALLYFCLADCLSELSSALPVMGGSFAYSRAILGPVAGFVVGNCENLMYCMFLTLLNVAFSDAFKHMYPETKHYAPLIWLLMNASCLYLVCRRNRWCWRIMEYGAFLCLFIIAAFTVFGITVFRPAYLTAGWELTPESSFATGDILHKRQDPSNHMDVMFLAGYWGPFLALSSTAWWFLGLESACHFSEETTTSKNISRGMYLSWFTLFLCMTCLSIFGVLVSPGAYAVSSSTFPMADVLESNLAPDAKGAFIWVVVPSLWLNMLATMMSASRETYTLSRSGYLPAFLSITNNSERAPARAACLASGYGLAASFLVEHLTSGNLPILAVWVSLVITCGCVAYLGVAISMLVLRQRYPKAPRTRKAILGYASPVCVILISLACLAVNMLETIVLTLTLTVIILNMLVSGAYIASNRFHLKPTEESLISSVWAQM